MPFLTGEEISSQPECWAQAAELATQVAGQMPRSGERVAFVGTGTAWYVAQAMAALRENAGQGNSDAFTANEMPRHRSYDRLVVLTRSGQAYDVNQVLHTYRGKVPTLAFVGDMDSESSELADACIDLTFADEASMVQTRFATTALALFRTWLGHDAGPLVEAAREALQVRLTDEMADTEQVTFLGRGWTVGLAHEAALKFRECAASWSESYPAMEYLHGPISIAEPGRLVWMLGDTPQGLAELVTETGAMFVANELDPMAELIIAQRLAFGRAMKLGLNPDHPRNMRKDSIFDD